jgi:putative DNA primase/helicase
MGWRDVSQSSTKAAAHGRWREILPAFGIDLRMLNGKHQACPMCGGKDRFRYDDKRGDGGFYCSQCGAGTGFTLIQRLKRWDFKTAAHEIDAIIGNLRPGKPAPVKSKPQSSRQVLNELWLSGRPISRMDPAGAYMVARGLVVDAECKALRFVPRLAHYGTKTHHPGMLALFCDATGKPTQLQRTYLTADGHKAALDPPRMFMPGDMPAGGAIRLGGAAEAMGVAEGVETALAAAQRFGLPVWATATEGLLQKWQPPPEAQHVIVFGDNDSNYVGQHAAYALAKRLVHESQRDKIRRSVEVRIPEATDTDWADHE